MTIFIFRKNKLQEGIVTNHSVVLRLSVPAVPQATGEELSATAETPWQWFGAFQNDPTWGLLFDKIERQRDAHLLGA